MIRVFIVDDHGVVRQGVRALLAADDAIEVVGEAADLDAAVAYLRRADRPVDVLILDLSLKGASGLDLLRRALTLRPGLAVLIHTMHAEAQYADRVAAEGAAGFLCKDDADESLVECVKAVARGRTSFPRRKQPADRPRTGHESLTPRELQIFLLLGEGQAVSDVARALDLGLSTVSTHVGRIREKLGVQTVGELVAYAHRHGLVE